jgi:catechol 2,3-dioxygenase-like lactoylglutathione lyase family enzyme
MRYAHTNIAARNWKTLSDFYVDVFGCTVKPPERRLSGDWLDQATGLFHAELEGVHLLLPGHGESRPTLEIFSYKHTYECEPVMANYTGITHIAFEVEDVEKIFRDALKHGATRLGEVTEKTIDGIGVLTFVYLRDPEGNIIEIQSWEK